MLNARSYDSMAGAVPDSHCHETEQKVTAVQDDLPTNPQDLGWADTVPYDYEKYFKSNKELAEIKDAMVPADQVVAHYPDAVGGIPVGDWNSNAAVYTWDDEFGDVGPEFPELERQLFASEFHVKSGIDFNKLSLIKVVQEGRSSSFSAPDSSVLKMNSGETRIKPIASFKEAGLHPVMLRNVELAGYSIPTPIQQYCLPAVFMGYDIVACAQTGSGKTAAFLIPILSKLMGKAKKLCAPRPNPAKYQPGISKPVCAEPLVCIVVPSRELATQIFDEARRFCYRSMLRPCVIYGGGPIKDQIIQLEKGCDVLIGTPGRLVDFINRSHVLTFRRLKYMVIDEADELVSNSWEQDMKTIMSGGDQEEGNITYLMFSATFPKLARQLAKEHLAMNHLRIRVGRAGSSHANIEQEIIEVDHFSKRKTLQKNLLDMPPARTIIFVNSKRSADELDDFLFNSAFPCTSIHSDRTQREREDSLRAFRTGKTPILIATGVSARGLDIHNVMSVINFDLPSSSYGGMEEYCHRIGRTGRIGNKGVAISFYTERDEDLAPDLVKFLLETHQKIPEFLTHHIPEGFNADGQGDENLLIFEDDSDTADDQDPNDSSSTWNQDNLVEPNNAKAGPSSHNPDENFQFLSSEIKNDVQDSTTKLWDTKHVIHPDSIQEFARSKDISRPLQAKRSEKETAFSDEDQLLSGTYQTSQKGTYQQHIYQDTSLVTKKSPELLALQELTSSKKLNILPKKKKSLNDEWENFDTKTGSDLKEWNFSALESAQHW